MATTSESSFKLTQQLKRIRLSVFVCAPCKPTDQAWTVNWKLFRAALVKAASSVWSAISRKTDILLELHHTICWFLAGDYLFIGCEAKYTDTQRTTLQVVLIKTAIHLASVQNFDSAEWGWLTTGPHSCRHHSIPMLPWSQFGCLATSSQLLHHSVPQLHVICHFPPLLSASNKVRREAGRGLQVSITWPQDTETTWDSPNDSNCLFIYLENLHGCPLTFGDSGWLTESKNPIYKQ